MTPRATIPGNTHDRLQTALHAMRQVQSSLSSRSATQAALIQAVNAAERSIPELQQIARDARRLLNEVRSIEVVG